MNNEKMAERQLRIDGKRKLCDFLEAHPEFQLPYDFQHESSVYVSGKEEFRLHVRMLGSGRKSGDDNFFRFTRDFGGATVEIVESRSAICERVVVTTREIEVEERDPVALAAIPTVKVKKQVEIVEWHCPDDLLGSATSESATN